MGAERFRVFEAAFGAETMQESHLEMGGVVEIDGVEVEEVGFDGEGVGAEGGAVADVGDSAEEVRASDVQCGDVDAVGGQQFGVGREVDSGNGVAGAVTSAGGGGAVDGEVAPENSAGFRQVARGDQRPDAAGGDGGSARDARFVGADGEAEVLAKLGEAGDVGFGLMTEAESFAFVDFDGMEGVAQDGLGEVAGRPTAEVVGEGKDEDEVETGSGEELQLFSQRRDERKARGGVEDVRGVGIEGDGYGLGVEGEGALQHGLDDHTVATVNAVKVADGDDRAAGVRAEFDERTGNLHG